MVRSIPTLVGRPREIFVLTHTFQAVEISAVHYRGLQRWCTAIRAIFRHFFPAGELEPIHSVADRVEAVLRWTWLVIHIPTEAETMGKVRGTWDFCSLTEPFLRV